MEQACFPAEKQAYILCKMYTFRDFDNFYTKKHLPPASAFCLFFCEAVKEDGLGIVFLDFFSFHTVNKLLTGHGFLFH